MTVNVRYECVDIDPVLYEPEERSYTMLQKFGRRLLCGRSKIEMEKAEKLLNIYNKERYKIATLIYSVAEYMRSPSESLKGIAINAKKEDFYTEALKDTRDEIRDVHSYFVTAARHIRIIVYVEATLVCLGMLGGIYPATRRILFMGIALVVILNLILLGTVEHMFIYYIFSAIRNIEKRLERAKDEKCMEYFARIYDSLELTSTNGNSFLYDIKEFSPDDAKIAYSFAKNIYEANSHRSIMRKTFTSSECLLGHSTV